MTEPNELRASAASIAPSVVEDRRKIHQRPELGYQETETAALVAERLRALGLEVRCGVGRTGVVALLRGREVGKTVLLRADMDALPIQEENETPYASRVPGVMHACGHDAHTAMLLGAAWLLVERRETLRGVVKLMFQPAEEGGAGAMAMIQDGLLEDPPVDAAFGLHVDAERHVGQVAFRAGPSLAASDRFTIVVRGKGGHAARPHRSIDPVVVGAQIVTALQTLVAREVSPFEPAVVTVGSLSAGTTYNIIPDTATLLGTVRTYNDEVRQLLERRIGELARGVASAMRATAEVAYQTGYPTLVNDEAMTELARSAVGAALGREKMVSRDPIMGAEDFSFVLQRVPGSMFFLGVRNPAWERSRPVHTATFDLDEGALPLGVAALVATATRYLEWASTAAG